MARSRGFLITRFTAPILMCPTNYDIAMLVFSKRFSEMRDGESQDGERLLPQCVCECHSSLSLSRGGVVMNWTPRCLPGTWPLFVL